MWLCILLHNFHNWHAATIPTTVFKKIYATHLVNLLHTCVLLQALCPPNHHMQPLKLHAHFSLSILF